MKKLLFLFILMLLRTALNVVEAQGQELTISDKQNSGCLSRTRGYEDEEEPISTIILTKEGSILSVEAQNIISNCATSDFVVKSNISEGNDGSPCTLSVIVAPVTGELVADCLCPFNVSFTIHDLEPNSFYLDCLWYKGLVELTEGETLMLEYIGITDVKINETTFPDSNFRNWVLSQDYGSDGVLTNEELENVTSLDLSHLEIHDLKGIEYFFALKALNCMTNKLTTLDLSNNIALEKLNCLGNRLTTINLQENKKLRYLSCVSNQLTTLDVSGCTELDTLACSGNQLTALNVSMNTKLISLECYGNQLSALDLSKNTALRRIHCNDNQLTSLDVSKNTALTMLQCSSNLLTTLDVTKNSAMTSLSCTNNKLTTLHVSNNKSLESIICFHNQLTSLDMSGCSALIILDCSYNQLTSLELSGCSALEGLGCNDNQLTTLDLSENTALTMLYCYHNQIKGAGMDALVESLPTVSEGSLKVMYFENEQNVMTTTQVATAKAKGWTPYLCTYSFSEEYAGSETSPKYFPTGMTWEEVGVTPDMGREYYNAHIYEISTDTIIGNVTYRKVLRDNVFSGLCVRESGDKVWLLTKEYPTEILLYNFDWDSNQEVVTEYLKGQGQSLMGESEEGYEVRQETTPVGNSQTVVINGKTYQYYMKTLSGTIIRGIGKVAELNRYPCLLSYREPAEILPGLDYFKVRWIKRNGVEIFRSEYAKEWTVGIMDDYRPFVEDDKVWKVGTISGNPVQIVDYYYFDGDTIIDGKTCKQMMCQRFVSPDYSNEYWTPTPSLSKVGAWYEEDKKVYFYDEITQSMRFMYDFSLAANDTLQFITGWSSPFIIGPKQTGGIKGFKGVYRDIVMCADEGQHFHSTFWLEGVGEINGPTRIPIDPILGDPVPEFLMSCVVGDEVIYYNDEYEDGATPAGARKNRFDFTHTIKEKPKARMRSEESQSLYGEYNNRQLGINLDPLDDAYQVSITNDSGKVVYEKAVNAGSIVGLNIDISKYPEGNYTVTVENSNESFTGEFKAQLTGIEEVRSKMIEAKGHIYNLQGQRLSRLQKGLNIVNGQKIYVKN